jgi:non-canonical (house-cleaning) NTP pyrophosphatase
MFISFLFYTVITPGIPGRRERAQKGQEQDDMSYSINITGGEGVAKDKYILTRHGTVIMRKGKQTA